MSYAGNKQFEFVTRVNFKNFYMNFKTLIPIPLSIVYLTCYATFSQVLYVFSPQQVDKAFTGFLHPGFENLYAMEEEEVGSTCVQIGRLVPQTR